MSNVVSERLPIGLTDEPEKPWAITTPPKTSASTVTVPVQICRRPARSEAAQAAGAITVVAAG